MRQGMLRCEAVRKGGRAGKGDCEGKREGLKAGKGNGSEGGRRGGDLGSMEREEEMKQRKEKRW